MSRYREVKRELGRKRPFPGGESLDDAARRYAAAYRDLLERTVRRVLVVCHEIPVRYALNAAAGSDALDGPPFHDLPNAMPFALRRRGARARRRADRAAGRVEAWTKVVAIAAGFAHSCSAGWSACPPGGRRAPEATPEAPHACRPGGVRSGAVLRGDARAREDEEPDLSRRIVA